MQRRVFSALAAACAFGLMAAPAAAQAQEKPTLKILVGFPPGGSVDIVARLLAERLRPLLDQNIIIDNKPGAAGRVALGELRRAAPDGNTVVLAPSGALVILPWLYRNIGYDPVKDFSPIARVTTFDFAVTAGPGSPPGNIRAVMDWFKANPSKASYGTSGAGTVPHFAGLLLGQAAGVNMVHVPYKGGAPAAQDLIGGQIPLMVDTASETIEHHRAGRLRILAVTGESRSQALPDVPTLRESGLNIAADAFFGLYGPAGLPADRAQRLSDAVGQVLAQPEVQARIRSLGQVPSHAGPQALAATQAEHLRRWEAPIKSSGYTPE